MKKLRYYIQLTTLIFVLSGCVDNPPLTTGLSTDACSPGTDGKWIVTKVDGEESHHQHASVYFEERMTFSYVNNRLAPDESKMGDFWSNMEPFECLKTVARIGAKGEIELLLTAAVSEGYLPAANERDRHKHYVTIFYLQNNNHKEKPRGGGHTKFFIGAIAEKAPYEDLVKIFEGSAPLVLQEAPSSPTIEDLQYVNAFLEIYSHNGKIHGGDD